MGLLVDPEPDLARLEGHVGEVPEPDERREPAERADGDEERVLGVDRDVELRDRLGQRVIEQHVVRDVDVGLDRPGLGGLDDEVVEGHGSHPFLTKPEASRAEPTAPMNCEWRGTTISVWRSSPIAWTSPLISEVPPTMITGSRMSTSWSCCS